MLNSGKDPLFAATSLQSYYFYRAAWIYHHEHAILQLVSGTLDDMARKKMRSSIDALRKYSPDPEHRRIHDKTVRSLFTPEHERTQRESSGLAKLGRKKDRIKGLPEGWRERFTCAALGHAYAAEIAVVAATGCRPIEIAKGVSFRREKGDGGRHLIVVTITGGKIMREGRFGRTGQPLRTLWIDDNSSVGAMFISALIASGTHEIAASDKPNAKSNRIQQAAFRASKRAFSRGVRPSIYDLRHAFAADLKAAGHSEESIAKAMGHATGSAQFQYAGAKRGVKGSDRRLEAVVKIEASNEVTKVKSRDPFLTRQVPAERNK
jgi:integrase